MAPIVHPRQDVVCLGINYDAHAQEAGRFSSEAFGGERPYTIYFSKRVNRATASGESVPRYEGLVDSLDYEAELGVILAKDAKGVSKENARDYIFGYTIINDMISVHVICRRVISNGIWEKALTVLHLWDRVLLQRMKSAMSRLLISAVRLTESCARAVIPVI